LTSIAIANLICAVLGIPVVLFLFRHWPHGAVDSPAPRAEAILP
jgi:hypothetical protein